MALIKCPECGNTVSDKANSCPNCGCPVSNLSPSGTVKIKMTALDVGLNGNQKVTVYKGFSGGRELWSGNVGSVAEIYFEEATRIVVKYHMSLMHYGGECEGIIDPAKSKKYNIQSRQGIMSTKLVLQAVDVIDS